METLWKLQSAPLRGIYATGERAPTGADGSARACTTSDLPWPAAETEQELLTAAKHLRASVFCCFLT